MLLAAVGCALAIAGCDEEVMMGADSGPSADTGVTPDGGDECEGRTLCTTLGTSCDGDEVVTCATDADGCRVETRDDCGADGDVCNVSGGTASCIDPCDLIPSAMRCTAAGRTCNGDSLEVCAANADGCFVITATDCAASPGGECDASGTEPMCVLPVDPCEGVADACTTAGTTCTGDDLVTCAPNAFGCLVATTTDCTARTGGACDATGTAAICTATDPCDGIVECAAAGTSCDGPELVTCAADAFGCLVETATDCTDTMFGFCDADAAPMAMCSTAATDPCMGMTICGTEPGRSCTDRSTLSICELNAFGCYTAMPTDCTTTSEVCDDTGTMPMCVDPCSLVDVCPAATYCDGDEIVTCTADADACLVESARTACAAGEVCDASGATAVCMTDTVCPQAGSRVLDCASGTVAGDTAMGSTVGTGVGACASTEYDGPEQYWRFRHGGTGQVVVTITSTTAATDDFDLFVLDGGDGTTMCTSDTLACIDESQTGTGNEEVQFVADPGDLAYVVYDIWDDATTTGTYSLAVTCVDVVCGDGTRAGSETCDDGDAVAGDGCSDTCTIEAGYACSGTPSVCTALAPNATCATATAITADTTITGESISLGGPRPMGTGCGTSSGNNALYYAVTVPPMTSVNVTTAGTFDRVLLVQDSCGAADCTFRTDSSPERTTLTNTSAAAITQIVAIHNFASTGSGTYDVTFTYTALAANATCAGATAITGNTTITGESPATGGPRPSGAGCGTTSGNSAHYYSVTVPPMTSVAVTTAGSLDRVLLVQDSCAATDCTFRTDAAPEGTTLVNSTATAFTRIVAVHNFSASGSASYDITFTYVAIAANATCAGATAVTGTTTITSEATAGGGASPTGTTCGTAGGPTLYYALTIPATTRVDLAVTPTGFNSVVKVLDACGAADCSARADTGGTGVADSATIANTTGAPVTRIVAINPIGTTGGTFDAAFTFTVIGCGNGFLDAGEVCDDGNTAAGDGCSATCTLEAADETFTSAGPFPISIPDNNTTGITSTLTVASTCTIAWVRPTWSITHTFSADIEMELVAPGGTTVLLTDDLGAGRDLLGPYTFASDVSPWPPGGTTTPIPAGTYGVDLSAFNGIAASGTWSLVVRDDAGADTGSLTGWSLELGCE